ncbi:nucleotidyltransferase domain-containing protein, partial [archaeon]
MHDEVVLKKIKRSVLETAKENKVEIYQIILFGSRVRGDYREDSDWDILVITKEKLDRDKFWKLYTSMKRKLASL